MDILGHAGYAEEGEDIVCAAISSAVMLTHALLYDVQHIPVDTLIEDEGAHPLYPAERHGGAWSGRTSGTKAAFFRAGTKLFRFLKRNGGATDAED